MERTLKADRRRVKVFFAFHDYSGTILTSIMSVFRNRCDVMKTTIELPDPAIRQARILASSQGMTLKQFFAEALEEKLQRCAKRPVTHETDPPWMAGFGVLSDLASENRRVLAAIEEEFETLSSEDVA